MKNITISIRLNPEKLVDRKVEEILSNLPTRRKSEYIKNAIIAYNDFERLIEPMKQAFLEAMDERESVQAEKKNETDGGYIDYLKSL